MRFALHVGGFEVMIVSLIEFVVARRSPIFYEPRGQVVRTNIRSRRNWRGRLPRTNYPRGWTDENDQITAAEAPALSSHEFSVLTTDWLNPLEQ
jgi:hypothetical protein